MRSFSEAEPLQGGNFTLVAANGAPLTIRLTEVRDKGSDDRSEQFSLLFQGPLDAPLAQGTYQLQHETLGTVVWMLVPVGKHAEGYSYEAAFNLLRSLQ